ncbi:hypothetical protein BJV78DRAFT_1215538 [Lactifluus subvellereus]|nr:hypothetical protein BJV78DRAFT_1215538 [Lactifluus subvellereus]
MTNVSPFSLLKQRRLSEQSRPLDDIPTPPHTSNDRLDSLVRDEAPITDSVQELAGDSECFPRPLE